MHARQKSMIQIVWGALLLGMGGALCFRVPQIIPEIGKVDAFSSDLTFKRICLYGVGVLLIGGGARKIRAHYKLLISNRENQPSEK